ncbi:MAG: PAS domain S-box protein [Deltaproteobacteria bacterium]|nr:PAS domain S-box protein [Deltaproteobacteria bacterium]
MPISRRPWVWGPAFALLTGWTSAWWAVANLPAAKLEPGHLGRPEVWGVPLAWAVVIGILGWLLQGRTAPPAPSAPPPDPLTSLGPLVEALPTPVLVLNAERRIAVANPPARALLDLPDGPSLGHPVAEFWSADGTPKGRLEVTGRDGSKVPIEVTLTPLTSGPGASSVVMLRDLRERPPSAAILEGLVRSSPHPAILCDPGPSITLANPPAERLFGYGPTEMEGLELAALVPQTHRSAHQGHVQSYFQDRQARTMRAGRGLVGVRKDGTEVHLEIGLTPLDSDRGHFTLATLADVSEQRRTEAELRRSNAELEQFAYVASHDLQEPLRMVASFTELLGQRYRGQLDEKADRYIHYAVDGAKRMQQLVADLLAYSRVGSQGKALTPVDSAAVLARVLEILGPRVRVAGANITADPLPVVWADEVQLQQLFQNLIGNALKFRRDVTPTVHLSARPDGPRWVFSCADNGLGIDIQYHERVFQMFQRLHERGKYEGSGIGLAIVKRILERHEGRIWLESQLGVGTTFYFTLTAAPEVRP